VVSYGVFSKHSSQREDTFFYVIFDWILTKAQCDVWGEQGNKEEVKFESLSWTGFTDDRTPLLCVLMLIPSDSARGDTALLPLKM
jgi:hypothetical protein